MELSPWGSLQRPTDQPLSAGSERGEEEGEGTQEQQETFVSLMGPMLSLSPHPVN